jgi:hypothetical protein
VVTPVLLGMLVIVFIIVSIQTDLFGRQYRIYQGGRFCDALRPRLQADGRFTRVQAARSTSGQVIVAGRVDCEADAMALIHLVESCRGGADVSYTIVLPQGCTRFYDLLTRHVPRP